MARDRVDELLRLLDQAFARDGWHSLVGNLGVVAPDAWTCEINHLGSLRSGDDRWAHERAAEELPPG